MIRVLVVDDSAIVRKMMEKSLNEMPGIQVVGTAIDPYVARDKIAELKPDVLTLDLEMPRMDGLTFLEKLMTHFPIPVVVVSSLAQEGSATAMRALTLGAVEVVAKPNGSMSVPIMMGELADAIRKAAQVRPKKRTAPAVQAPVNKDKSALLSETTDHVIAIGSSTGGPAALESVLAALPVTTPGIVIAQHIPAGFSAGLAQNLNRITAMEVREAKDGDLLMRGRVLIAPGGRHMELRRDGAGYVVRLHDDPPMHHVRPAVDILFNSVAKYAGSNSMGIVLTGMGVDGAVGLAALRKAGAKTIAQDEDSCVVFGMPRAAIDMGGAQQILPLSEIGPAIAGAARLLDMRRGVAAV